MRRVGLIVVFVASIPVAAAVAETLPDPTRPMDFVGSTKRAVPAAPAAPVLQSTVVSPDRKVAVISGKRVRIGDTYNGAVVTDITPYEVRMNRGGRETSLRLHPKLTEKGTLE